jgi:uncharacterized protein YjbI with pentapeptide repeats
MDLESDEQKYYEQTFCELSCSQQKISGKEFDGCHFDSCDFSEAIFLNCEFTECTFTECNLSVLNVDHSKFTDVNFIDCKLIGVNWIRAYWRDVMLGVSLKFKRCLLNSSSFYGLNLAKIVIEDCRAHDVDFREGNFSGASFFRTDLTNSLFDNTTLTGANFNEAKNYDININSNVITNATFCRYEAVRLLESLNLNLID